MKPDRPKANVLRLTSHLLAAVLLVANCSGCFRIYIPEQAKRTFEEFGPDPLARDRNAACARAVQSLQKDSPYTSPYSILLAGRCYESGFSGQVPTKQRAMELYQLAMVCGSSQGRDAFVRLGGEAQPLTSYEGVFFLPPKVNYPECGFEKDATTVGYASAIIAAPVALVGGVALLALGIPIWVISGIITGKA